MNNYEGAMKKTLVIVSVGMLLALAGSVPGATVYVSLESTNPVVPYGTWETAARNIQQAVDAARAGDTVLVTNGVYAVGTRGLYPASLYLRQGHLSVQ